MAKQSLNIYLVIRCDIMVS